MSEPLGYRFPLDRSQRRDLAGYAGPIDVWDIDKTYLLTRFERLRDLLRRALESAVDKETRPGAAPLLAGLRRGPTGDGHPVPLYFVSASPPQLRPVLEEKMHLDGVEFDGIAFKDHLALLRRGRLREIKRHTAYKLTALLEYRCEWPAGGREWLYGDDAELDASIYSIYADIRAGTLGGRELDKRLADLRVADEDRRAIDGLVARAGKAAPAPEGGSVEAIFIFRQARRPKLDLTLYPRVTPVADALALAEVLRERGRIAPRVVDAVRADIARSGPQPAP